MASVARRRGSDSASRPPSHKTRRPCLTLPLIVFVVTMSARSAHAQGPTFLYFDSKPGDYVGQGQQFTLTPADGAFTLPTISGAAVWIQFRQGPRVWNLMFAPPAGSPLAPGIYERATRYPIQSPTTPGLDVSGEARGCNRSNSRFVVYENDLTGPLPRFAADYEQHCEGKAPALFGSVRYNSSVPMGPRVSASSAAVYEGDGEIRVLPFVISLSAPASAPVSVDYAVIDGTATGGSDYLPVAGTASFGVGQTAAAVDVAVLGDTVAEGDETVTLALSNAAGAPILVGQGAGTIRNDDPDRTFIRFDSPVGDWVGLGQHFTLTPLDGDIVVQPTTDAGVQVKYRGATPWDLFFVPPAGSPLALGVFEGATRWPFQSPMTPGMDVFGDGRGCNAIEGRFVVLEIQFAGNGGIERFAADYEQHCDGDPPLSGAVRFNSSIPLTPRLSVSSAAAYEGDGAPRSLVFTVSLSIPSSSLVSVDFQTADGSANLGSDYLPVAGTLSLAPGETVARIEVPLVGDLVPEADETLFMRLANPVGVPISFGQGLGSIRNDDPNTTALVFIPSQATGLARVNGSL